VQHGKVHTFRLRFKKSIADRARTVQFHPSQKVISKSNRDGEYVIELKCSGHQEVFHELTHPDWLARVLLEGDDNLMSEFQRYSGLVAKMAAEKSNVCDGVKTRFGQGMFKEIFLTTNKRTVINSLGL